MRNLGAGGRCRHRSGDCSVPATARAGRQGAQALMAEIRMLQEEQQQVRRCWPASARRSRRSTPARRRRQPRAEGVRRSEARHREPGGDDAGAAREVGRDQRPPVVDDAGAAVAAADDGVDAGAGAAHDSGRRSRAGAIRRRRRRAAAARGWRPRRRTSRRRRCGIASMPSTPPASTTSPSKASSPTSAPSRRRRRPTTRSSTSATRFTAPGKYPEAVAALQKVISDYPQSDSVPAAYYKMGLAYEALKQFEPARRAFETVIKNHPEHRYEATLAQAGAGDRRPGQEVKRGTSPEPAIAERAPRYGCARTGYRRRSARTPARPSARPCRRPRPGAAAADCRRRRHRRR